MKTRRGWSVMLGLACGFLLHPPFVGAAHQATPASSPEAMDVVEQQVVEVPGFRVLSMSPDGRWLLGLDDTRDRLCGIAIETVTAQGCAELGSAGFRGPFELSVAWSPDGTRVAMTEDSLLRSDESDVWVFEAATGRLTDLTDDGVTGPILSPGQEAPPLVDLFPTWSPDGQAIAFARAVRGDDGWVDAGIFRIAAAGGTPVQVAPLPDPDAFPVYPALRWSADGRFLAYSVLMADHDDPANGVWVIDAEGTTQRQVLTGDLRRPILVELSARGVAFIASADYVADPRAHAGPRFAAVDLASGATTSLDTLPPPMWGTPTLPMLTFSPDGSRLLYITIAQPPDRRLQVYDLDRQETRTLLDPIETWFGGRPPTGMVWGRNDLVFVPGPRGSAILLHLGG